MNILCIGNSFSQDSTRYKGVYGGKTMNLPDIEFGKLIYKEHEGKNVYVHSYGEVGSDDYNSYIEALTNESYEKKKII